MASSRGAKPNRMKVQEHRARLRARGLRPVQFWVPDMRSAAFRKDAHDQSVAVSESAGASDDQAFIDAVSALNEG